MKSQATTLIALIALATLTGTAPPSPAADRATQSIQDVYNQGRAAFFRNDFATAKRLLTRVNQADPNHRPTIILLKNITMAEQEAAAKTNSLEGRLRRTSLPRLDLADARVPDVLEFIQLKAAEVSADRTKPNFVVRLTEEDQRRSISLQLNQPSLHAALAAVATLADLDVVYDSHTVTIRSRRLTPAPATTTTQTETPAPRPQPR